MAAASLVIVEMFLTAIAVTLRPVLVGDLLFSSMLSVTPERPGRPRSGSAVATHLFFIRRAWSFAARGVGEA